MTNGLPETDTIHALDHSGSVKPLWHTMDTFKVTCDFLLPKSPWIDLMNDVEWIFDIFDDL